MYQLCRCSIQIRQTAYSVMIQANRARGQPSEMRGLVLSYYQQPTAAAEGSAAAATAAIKCRVQSKDNEQTKAHPPRFTVIVNQNPMQMLNICSDICFVFEGRVKSGKLKVKSRK